MLIKKYGDIIVGLVFTFLSVGMVIMARMLPKSAIMDIGPEFMPTVIGIFTLVLSVILLVTSLKKLQNFDAGSVTVEDADYKRVLMSFLCILVYVFILQPVGFIISTIVYLPLQMLVLAPEGERKPVFLAVISVIFTFVVFFLFRYGFKIILPAGIFTINL